MRPTDVRTHLDVPAHQLKLGRSKSLNAPKTSTIAGMNVRPKRTYSLPNRERSSLPIVQINFTENTDRVDEDNFSDKDTERGSHSISTGHYASNGENPIEPLVGVLLSIIFLIWSWMLEAFNL